MKQLEVRFVVALLALGTLAPLRASAPTGSNARARELIEELHLSVLPKESGYLGLIGTSAQKVQIGGRSLAVQSQVYYMLTTDRPINYLHWLAPDDTHILIEGGPVDYFIFHPDGRAEKLVLGRDLATGERPVVAVPGGCWKALRLHAGARYALMAMHFHQSSRQTVFGSAKASRGLSDSPAHPVGHSGESSRVDRSELDSLGCPGSGRTVPARSRREAHVHRNAAHALQQMVGN